VLGQLGVTDPLLDVAVKLEQAALQDEYFVARKLYPNVDFYSGIIYKALGIPTEMFTVMFALGRTPGWVSHWLEQQVDPEMKIVRARSTPATTCAITDWEYAGFGPPCTIRRSTKRPSRGGVSPKHPQSCADSARIPARPARVMAGAPACGRGAWRSIASGNTSSRRFDGHVPDRHVACNVAMVEHASKARSGRDAMIGQVALDRLRIIGMQMQLRDGGIGHEAIDGGACGSGRKGQKTAWLPLPQPAWHGACRRAQSPRDGTCGGVPQCLRDVRLIGPLGRAGARQAGQRPCAMQAADRGNRIRPSGGRLQGTANGADAVGRS
jgi:hypothetical protein